MLKSKAIAIRALGRRLHLRYNLTKLVDAIYEELFVQEIMSRLPEYIEKAKKARRRIPIPKRTPAATVQRFRLMTAEATLEHRKEVTVRFGEMRREVVGNLRKTSKDFYNWKRNNWVDKAGFDVERWLFNRQKWRTILSKDNARLVGAQAIRSAEDAIEGYGIGRSFNQVDKRAIRWLAENAKNSGWSIADTTYDELRETLMEAVAEGWSIPTIAGRVESFFEDITAARAELIARTETLKGTNRGTLEGMRQSGVVEGKEWLCTEDDRTCDMCLEMDGKKMALEEPFFEKGDTQAFGETEMSFDYEDIETPPLHPDCVLPGTYCKAPGGIISGLSAWYDGPVIELILSNGARVSVTRNHMFLTPNGFSAAHQLRKGDDIFYCARAGPSTGGPDDNRKPTLIEKKIKALAKSSGMAMSRVKMSPEYLHGDARFVYGDVDVIRADSLLKGQRKTNAPKLGGKSGFGRHNPYLTHLTGKGNLVAVFKALAFAADGGVGGTRKPSPFFAGRALHSDEHGCASVAGPNASLKKTQPNPGASEAKAISQCLLRFPGLITTSKVVDINEFTFHGLVYDLECATTLYVANGLVSSNCRCTLLAVFDEQADGWKLNGLERDHLPESEIPEVGPERDDLCRKLIEKDYLQTYGTKLAREEAMSYRKAVEGFAAQDSAMIRYAQLGVRDMFSSDAAYEKYLELGNKIEDFIKFSAKFPKETVIYRGIAEDELGLSRALVEVVKKTPTGSTIELKSTSHWTTDKLIAGRYDGEILFEVKSAKRAAAISHLSIFENEREVMVSKDCVFKIIKKSHKVIAGVKRWVITLEAV